MPATFILILLVLIGFTLLLAAGVGVWLVKKAFYPRKFTYEESYQREIEKGRINKAEFESWDKQDIIFKSPFGYDLSGSYFPQSGSNKTIILLHGISYTRLGMVKYMPIFRRRGWNILIYDQRYFGRSGGPNTTYGFYEKHDLRAAIDWAESQIAPDGVVGTLGESLGAGTCLQLAAIDPRPAFVIADSSFATLWDEFAFRLKTDYNLPPYPVLNIGNWWIRMLAGFRYADVSPERDVAHLEMPVLLIHGLADDEVPPSHSQRLFDAKRHGLRRLFFMPEAIHVQSVTTGPAAYDQWVGEFLQEAGI
ncbi:MAG: alpha/beta hydrolase [Bellilinea sp.]